MSTTGPVPCFLIVPTDRYRMKLRRYASSAERPCPSRGAGCCDASTILGEERHDEHPSMGDDSARYPHDDARWPTVCARCGGAFTADDAWQVFPENVYVRSDGAAGEFFLRELPAGAMYDATWLHELPDLRGPDGRSYIVRLPDGADWLIDGPSKGGGHWSRTGEAPKLTAQPSILTPGYHGWLRDGVLVPC